MDLTRVNLLCIFGSYLLACLFEFARLNPRFRWAHWAGIIAASAGLIANTIYLVIRSRAVDLPPLLASSHDWLLVLSWLTALLYLVAGLFAPRLAFGVFLLPIVVLLVAASNFAEKSGEVTRNEQYWWGMLHAALLLFGFIGIALGFVLSLMYLLQHRRLKLKRTIAEGTSFLSLERLSRLNWWAIILAVPLLTLGLAIGVWLALRPLGGKHQVVLTSAPILANGALWIATIGLFVWLLVARRPSGRLVAWRTLLAGGFVISTVLILQMISPSGLHGRQKNAAEAPPPTGSSRRITSEGQLHPS